MAHRRQCIRSPGSGSEKVPRITEHTGHPDTSQTRTSMPKDSDFFPSVSLAAVLTLVFISVLPMLFQPGVGYVPARTVAKGKVAHFHPLLYGQPLSTQLTLERLNENGDEVTTVLAVAEEDTIQTLLCFSTNVISLLSKQGHGQSVTKRLREHRPLVAPWNKSATRRSKFFSVAVITQRRGQDPHCVILGPPNPVNGNINLMEITLSISPVGRRSESFILADDLLQHLYKTGQVPETFEVRESTRQHLGVIHIVGDPYLESGIVC